MTGNVFNAGQVFTPGGDDRINSLQDEDVLTGTGTNPTLNFTFGNPNDNGGTSITPTLNGVSTVNVAFTANNGAIIGVPGNTPIRLDLQDATGLTNAVNITRVSDTSNNVQVDNLLAALTNLSVANSNSGTATIGINFAAGALAGAADATTLTLNRVNVVGLSVEDTDNVLGANTGAVGLTDGYETINLVSSGAANTIGTFSAEDLRVLNISGNQNLTLGTTNNTVSGNLVEATRYNAGLANVTGSLTTVNASTFTGNLDYTIGGEILGIADNTSGVPVNMSITGGSGNDTFRLALGSGVQATDRIDGGTGNNTLTILGNAAVAGTVANVQTLEIRGGHDDALVNDVVDVNSTVITNLANTFVRNEGQTNAPGVNGASGAEGLIARVHSMTAAQATGVTVAHGTTGNNALFVTNQNPAVSPNNPIGAGTAPVTPGAFAVGQTRVNIDVGAGVTTAAVTIVDGVNTNPRFNFSLVADSDTEAGAANAVGIQANNRNATNTVANVNIIDNDTESNTIELVEFGRLSSDAAGPAAGHSGTITITGTSTGFLNLDATRNAYRYDLTGAAADGGTAGTPANTNGTPTFGHRSGTTDQYGERLIATNFNSTAYAGSVVIRVADSDTGLGGQNIQFGAGNDTVIFDQVGVTAVNRRTAGLTISDTVAGGAGNDILAFDGNGVNITIGASEWTNVSGFEIVRLVGNGVLGTNTFNQIALGGNAYNLVLTNELLANNGTLEGGVKRIVIVNDNDASNDVAAVGGTADDANANPNGAAFGGTGQETGVNIDARILTANNSFAYYGEEGATRTNDRFILADANINGAAIIDGGAVSNDIAVTNGVDADSLRNADIADVRNSAVVTLGDLANLRNIGTFEFRNDSATNQNAILELNDDAVDRLVDAYQASRIADAGNNISQNQETLLVKSINNPVVLGAVTNLNIQGSTMTGRSAVDVFLDRSQAHNIVTGGGNDTVVLLGNFNAGVYGNDAVTGENINAYANNTAGALVYNATTVINLGGQTGTAAGGENTTDRLVTYGNINLVNVDLTSVEALVANSDVTLNGLSAAYMTGPNGSGIRFATNAAHTLTITGAGQVDLSKITLAGGTLELVLAGGATSTGMAAAGVTAVTVQTVGDDGDNSVNLNAGANSYAGLGGNDSILGNGGNDTLLGGNGNDTIDGGTGADSLIGGAGADTFGVGNNFALSGQSLAATATTFTNGAATTIENGETLTFGNGVDIITDFVSGVDKLDVGTPAAPTNANGVAGLVTDLNAGTIYTLLGTFTGGVFTVNSAATAATANVATLVVVGTAGVISFANETGHVILTGVTALQAADFI